MADLLETSQWPAGIYQIEQTDPVVGGPPDLPQGQGIANASAQQLADRTLWLKNQLATTTSAAALLVAIKTVDGSTSGLNADLLDGNHADYFATKAEFDALAATGFAVQADIDAAIDALVGGAPGALDTLNELAAAMADDASFAASVTVSLANKLDVGGTAANSTLLGGSSADYYGVASRGMVDYDAMSDPDVSGLLSGSTYGRVLKGGPGSHVVIGVKGNDANDGLHVIDTNGGGDVDFARVLLNVASSKFKYMGQDIWHAGNSDFADRLTFAPPVATTAGTLFDFSAIPAGVNAVIVAFDNVGLSGTNPILIELGDAGGLETSGYRSTGTWVFGNAVSHAYSTAAFIMQRAYANSFVTGSLEMVRTTGNKWIISGVTTQGDGSLGSLIINGSKTLSGELTQLRVTRDGADTFTSGEITIGYRS